MDINDLKEIISLIMETDISELQIEKDGIKVKIRRNTLMPPIEIPQKPPVASERAREAETEKEDTQRLVTVTSPIVGTFYRSPSPDAPPFVDAGAMVRKGQVICIIEAMKLMNEIESEADGIIVRALVENGHPVEYGEPLFLIDPVG
jgi:acetyl-CoA carboxylase biotin carboxyl carrier protein